MATSGTYGFNPSAGDVVLNAFSMIGVRRWEITDQHLEDAFMASNLLMVEFSNRNPNCWARETVAIPLLPSTPTYDLPPQTVTIAFARIQQTFNTVITDRAIGPLSMNDYDALPNKLETGAPTTFCFRLLTPIPNVSVWPLVTDPGVYTAIFSTFRQMQDVTLPNGVTLDSPYRFLDAFTKGLAYRLATYYPPKDPQQKADLKSDYLEAFSLAAQRDQESTGMFIRPQFTGYFR